eukprot:6194608-Pleurochrysis_carterae.AAC.1
MEAEHKREMAALELRATSAEGREAEMKSACLDRGGRPRGHAARAELEGRWEQMSGLALRSALCRHSGDIRDALLDAGCEDWLPSCLALALRSVGLMDDLLRTNIVAEERFKLVKELAELLEAEWSIGLSFFVRSKLNISDRDYDKLRQAFSKKYDASKSRWVSRMWYQCPVLGKSLSIPEPLVLRYRLAATLKSYSEAHGLALSADGK